MTSVPNVDSRDAERLATLQRQRAQVAGSKVQSGLPRRLTTAVVGVTFADGYPANLTTLAAALGVHPEGLAATLVRDAGNPHDAKAVAVRVDAPALGRVGHLPRALAARIGPSIDDGAEWSATVTAVRVKSGHETSPGLDVHLERADG